MPSNVTDKIPAPVSLLASAPLRSNFATIKSEIEQLQENFALLKTEITELRELVRKSIPGWSC